MTIRRQAGHNGQFTKGALLMKVRKRI